MGVAVSVIPWHVRTLRWLDGICTCELEAGLEGVGVMEACALLSSRLRRLQQFVKTSGLQHTGDVQLCRFIGLCRSDTSGKQIFCVRAVWLPCLCAVSWMYLKAVCSLYVCTECTKYRVYRAYDLLSMGHAVYSHALHLGDPSHIYRSLSFSACSFSLREGFYFLQVI